MDAKAKEILEESPSKTDLDYEEEYRKEFGEIPQVVVEFTPPPGGFKVPPLFMIHQAKMAEKQAQRNSEKQRKSVLSASNLANFSSDFDLDSVHSDDAASIISFSLSGKSTKKSSSTPNLSRLTVGSAAMMPQVNLAPAINIVPNRALLPWEQSCQNMLTAISKHEYLK